MSEIHRYSVVKMLTEDGNKISYDPHGPEVVVATHYDDAVAQRDELLEALIEVTASLAWNAHGECRSVHEGPIMPSAMAIETAHAAIAKARGN